ncbi:MAG: chromosomal replication initiator protein DnaA [Syntrophomonadaceae bacterium]|nr:chromosomal replication initiator protein DnaA [Syntrophomonadaceae bacterium]
MSTDSNYATLLAQVLEDFRQDIGPTSFDIWFSHVTYNTFRNDKLYIMVPNALTKEWIESRYLEALQKKASDLAGEEFALVLITEPLMERDGCISPLNPKYTFETFVVGNSNRFAHAACYAVGEAPSRAYNPLFIYGGVGLGKTHLMQAIAHRILVNKPNLSVMYVSSEQFTNELISAIKDDTTPAFRHKYRNIDVLLIDDIQFLAGKERTQEEFFHTFNTLYEANKQVVISSDRPPRSIPTLEDRLRSRFEWGLITDIQIPDLETRIAILRKKAQNDELNVPYDVLDYIANYIDSNIRELEGALVRLVAFATINNLPLNLETAGEALKDIMPPPQQKKVTIECIQKEVCKYYGLNLNELLSKKRNKQLVYARHIAMFLCRRMTDASFPLIGDQFGGRDHTTVMHGVEKIEKESTGDPVLAALLDKICKQIDPRASL